MPSVPSELPKGFSSALPLSASPTERLRRGWPSLRRWAARLHRAHSVGRFPESFRALHRGPHRRTVPEKRGLSRDEIELCFRPWTCTPFAATPHPAAARARQADRLARQRRHHAEAAGRDRRPSTFTPATTPTSTAPPIPWRRAPPMPMKAPGKRSKTSSARLRQGNYLHPRYYRSDQSRGPNFGKKFLLPAMRSFCHA